MVRIRQPLNSVGQAFATVRDKDIVNPEHRLEEGECRTEAFAGLLEAVLPATYHTLVCV